jgi:hypothetical protein
MSLVVLLLSLFVATMGALAIFAAAWTRRLGKEDRQNVGSKVYQTMAYHVGDQIAAPKIENTQNPAERQGDQDIGRASCPVAKREDNKWNSGRPSGRQTHGLEPFDRVAAVK